MLALSGALLAHCRGLDRAALKQLYEVLDGASWANNDNWNVTDDTPGVNLDHDPCSTDKRWHGVGFLDPCRTYLDDIVDAGTAMTTWLTEERSSGIGCFAGRVTSLRLAHNNLNGSLHNVDFLGDLTNLTSLDLAYNSIGGTLPVQIGNLANVQIVQLSNNELSGTMPSHLGLINANGPDPHAACGADRDAPCELQTQLKLTDLDLSRNAISGSLPPEARARRWKSARPPPLHPPLTSPPSCPPLLPPPLSSHHTPPRDPHPET